jgi:hypothetical protein
MAPWYERACELARRLEERGAWTYDERTAACEVAWNMLKWGRTTRQSRYSPDVVEAVFRRALGMPIDADPPMNSGWTKVAALATAFLEGDPRRAPHVIWDSRVSTSLVFRLDELLVEEGRADAKQLFPRIGVVPGRGGSRAPGRARHLSRLQLRWSYAYGRWPAQDAGSELVRELRDLVNEGDYGPMPTTSGSSSAWTVRGVESVLFMDGY